MDILEKEAFPGRIKRSKTTHPAVARAITNVIDGKVARFRASELKTLGYKNMKGLEQVLRRQADYLNLRLSISHYVDPSTGMDELWVLGAEAR